MNIDHVLVASQKRTAVLQSIEKNSTKCGWVLAGAVGAWVGSLVFTASAPDFASTTVGAVHTASVAALLAMWGAKALRDKKLKTLENTIIEAGNEKEQPKAAQFNTAEKQAKKVNWAYNLSGVAVGVWGYKAVIALAPQFVGASVLQTVAVFGSLIVAQRLSSKHNQQTKVAQYERSSLADKIAKRHNVAPTQPKVAVAKLK